MKIIFSKSKQTMQVGDKTFTAWCKVRNELNEQRRSDEVVYTEPIKNPYYPRRFPTGVWNISRPRSKTDPYLYPFFIPTDAWQMVDIWLVKDGKYVKPTGAQYRDEGYGIHFSTSNTTLGCIRIGLQKDLEWLVSEINKALDKNEYVTIEVME